MEVCVSVIVTMRWMWSSLPSLYCLQHPATIGCDRIQDYEIWYRLVSEDTDNWHKERQLSASSTSYTLTGLEQEDYVIRVVVFNTDDRDNYAEKTYGLGMAEFIVWTASSFTSLL